MFPTTHDITLGNMVHTLPVLRAMLEAGNKVLVVSKPHPVVIQTICSDFANFKDSILFRFTIGSANDETLRFWEPGAPSYIERVACLACAHATGFQTSVSMEPLLETDEDIIVALVEGLASYVTDSIWLGKMNKPIERLTQNGVYDAETAKWTADLMASQSDERIKALYGRLKNHPKVKWKESIKAVVGLDLPTEAGLDL
jgi:DNA repair photolyase